jgi:hypothetical protein
MAGMVGMADRQKKWQNGRMAEMATYVLFMVHTNDDNDDDTLIFYITEAKSGLCPPDIHITPPEQVRESDRPKKFFSFCFLGDVAAGGLLETVTRFKFSLSIIRV